LKVKKGKASLPSWEKVLMGLTSLINWAGGELLKLISYEKNKNRYNLRQ